MCICGIARTSFPRNLMKPSNSANRLVHTLRMARYQVMAAVLVLGSSNGWGAEPAQVNADKSQYTLFNPTPRELMREMSTDRPDQTESPISVDAGHFQVEMDLVGATFDHDRSGPDDVRTEAWSVAPMNLKVGLWNNVDLQLMIDPFIHVRTKDRVAGTITEDSGFGDITTRVKINLWGNDGGKTALAVMPFVKWPLSESDVRNGQWEGGIIVPFSFELPAGWSSTVMTEVDFVSDGSSSYDTEFFNTITVARDLTQKLGFYLEFAATVSTASRSPWQGQVDGGLTYAWTPDLQLDLGCNFGVTSSAPDFNPFVGISFRY
jgi:hypothetical protein